MAQIFNSPVMLPLESVDVKSNPSQNRLEKLILIFFLLALANLCVGIREQQSNSKSDCGCDDINNLPITGTLLDPRFSSSVLLREIRLELLLASKFW